ncbi:TRAP-type C4-dicarboxylate transport system substrate-binding protein [Hasllibacter halocynthiae]|uniref:TRAP-type C4-dicarboxylate transport system substrate-binding protein n=1 Tax=Hasllibacter halocynthiae TaxID=595589 RepID=A0A2T0X956_9RHOB|nr:C4-dicarboxylate ABC transporter substrate-binding protein [Hasllibacter halocynthiae]PRY95459.1 TRAP-type C4-dicarboxylate transport system substrate-binding protein [Hasllibacter halocynthiae]
MGIIKDWTAGTGSALAGAGLLAGMAGVAAAQDVTLRMKGSEDIVLSGELVEHDEESYTISSTLGPLTVERAAFDCIGEGCPDGGVEAAQDGPVVWDVSLWGSRRAFTEHVEKLAELVDERTNGEFTLNISYGGLAPSRENLDGIAAGSFEMAQFCAGYHPEKNPSITVLELPFLGIDSIEEELAVSRAIYAHPAVQDDLARWNATLLMPTPQPQYNIVGVGQPPTSLGSFRGMTIRSAGGVGRAIEALGAEAQTIPAPQVRDALADGSIQAVAFAPHAHMSFGTIDSGSWWTTNLNPGTANCPVVVNSEALEALSTSNRVALVSSVDEALEHFVENYEGATMDAWGPALDRNFIIQITLRDDILQAIGDAVAAPAAEAWIEENAARGLPARELYDLVTATIEAQR